MEKTPEQIAADLNENIAAFKAQVEKAATKEDVSNLNQQIEAFKTAQNEKLEGLADKTELTKLEEILVKQGNLINEMSKGENQAKPKGIASAFKEVLTTDKVNELIKEQGSGVSTVSKVAGTILVSTNTTGRVASFERDPERARTKRRNPFMLELVNVSTTSAANVTYVERNNPDGAPGMTAEGAVKPLIDFDYIERIAAVKKMTARAKMSKEMIADVDGFVADTEEELQERLLLLFDEQLLSGDGLGQNLVGIETNATPFAAGALADTIELPNNFDVLRVAINQVTLNNFDANTILMNPSDVASMDLTRAIDGHYIMPPFASADGTIIRGIRIVENNGVGIDDFVVGDFNRFKVKIREDLNINYGHSGDDFERNLLTALCEGRATSYIPNVYFGAIVKGTFTAAKAALITP